MPSSPLVDRFTETLLTGCRTDCRALLRDALDQFNNPADVYHQFMWPATQQIMDMFREDRINTAEEHMAVRMARALADQLQTHLPQKDPNGKRLLITCADGENEELSAQMCADLFEANGWDVYFVGGGVPNDEVLSLVGQLRPDILLVFGTQPHGVPQVRILIDQIRDIGSNPTMNVMISGGVFNRADGLWEEVHADLFAKTADEALQIAEDAKPRKPEIRIPGAPKKRRRRRKPTLLMMAEGGTA